MKPAVWFDSGAQHPHRNMALDEALLEAHRPGGRVLRLYGWEPHALSLGYFQPAAEAARLLEAFPSLVLTRRPTGGGAIVHAHELTYALVADAPAGPGGARDLYARMNRAIVFALRAAGAHAAERGGAPGTFGRDFLCFERHADFDVAVAGRKIAGSAQRRKGGAILQHGSILLAPPPGAGPGLTSAAEAAGRDVAAHEITAPLVEGAGRAFEAPFEPGEPPPAVLERARELVAERYGSEAWIRRR